MITATDLPMGLQDGNLLGISAVKDIFSFHYVVTHGCLLNGENLCGT